MSLSHLGDGLQNGSALSAALLAVDDSYMVSPNQTLVVDAMAGVLANDSYPDGVPLTLKLVSGTSAGNLTLQFDGSFQYTPLANFHGVDSFRYQVSDGQSTSNIVTVRIAVNDAPLAVAESYTVNEGGTLTVDDVDGTATPGDGSDDALLINDSDPDNDSLTAFLVTDVMYGTLTLNANGTFSYVHGGSEVAIDSFAYHVNDGAADSNVVTVLLHVTPVNDPPVAIGNNYSVSEGGALTTFDVDGTASPGDTNDDGLLVNDTDAEGDTLLAVLVSDVSRGTLTFNTDGTFSYVHGGSEEDIDSFAYRVNDGMADSNVATVFLHIEPVNDPPVATGENYFVSEGGTLTTSDVDGTATPSDTNDDGLLINDTDVEGDSLQAVLVSDVSHGTLTLNTDGTFSYVHDGSEEDIDSFTYQVNDGTANSNVVTVSLDIAPVNDPAVATGENYSVSEGGTLTISDVDGTATPSDTNDDGLLVNDTDAEGDGLLAVLVSDVSHGTLTFNDDGTFSYVHNGNETSSDFFSYRVNDGTIGSNIVRVTIAISPVNDAPEADDQSVTAEEDTPVLITLTGSDPDGDTLTFSLVSSSSFGNLSGTGSSLTYTPGSDFNGVDSFTFMVNDGVEDSQAATVSINVTPVNDSPRAQSQSLTVQEDGLVAITLTGSDVDGDPLSYSIADSPMHGTLTGFGSRFDYVPHSDFYGSDSFTFRANDAASASAPATVSITVTPVDDRPTAEGQMLTIREDEPQSITLTGSDLDGDSLSYIIMEVPSHGILSGTAPDVVYTPNSNYNGPDSFTFKVDDGTSDSSPATISISVLPVNDSPSAATRLFSTLEDTPLSITLLGSEVDAESITYSLLSLPLHGELSGTAPHLRYTPNPNFSGTDSFQFNVKDGLTESPPATVVIDVVPVNDPPVADHHELATDEDTPLAITLTASDPDGDHLTYRFDSPAHGTLSGTAPQLHYTPDSDYHGVDSFSFHVDDGSQDSQPATVTINVSSINDAPVADHQELAGDEDTPLAITLTASDRDGDLLTYRVNSPAHGTLSGTAPQLHYTPDADYHGVDSFSFQVDDGSQDSQPATVTINVIPINDLPVADSQELATDEDTPLAITLTASDRDGDPLTYRFDSPAHGTLSGTAPQLHYTPDADYHGVDSFSFHVDDGSQDSQPATVTINLIPIHDPPRIELVGDATVAEGSPFILRLRQLTNPDGGMPTRQVVHWGDGSSETYSYPSDVTHIYRDDNASFNITVDLEENNEKYEAVSNHVVSVVNVPPHIVLTGSPVVPMGSVYRLTLGDVTDPGEDTVSKYVVHWGDGSSDVYPSRGEVTHVYSEAGNPTIQVDLSDEDDTYQQVTSLSLRVHPPWQNPVEPMDADGDGIVAAGDILSRMNEANKQLYVDKFGNLPIPAPEPVPFYYDLDGDGLLSPVRDILPIISFLSRQSEGEGWAKADGISRESAATAANAALASSGFPLQPLQLQTVDPMATPCDPRPFELNPCRPDQQPKAKAGMTEAPVDNKISKVDKASFDDPLESALNAIGEDVARYWQESIFWHDRP